ncbi:MAG: hypothetical protein LC104_07630 [Bacteroidales bacterium]|nr:hypothetical protein [Bacteroidales bacterium]
MAKNILAWSKSANQFYREIGERAGGKPPRIYLGDDERTARANVVRLEGLWEGVESRWNDLRATGMAGTEQPVWDEVTLQLAKAVGRGLFKVTVQPPDNGNDGWDLAVWIADLRSYFPQIQINLPSELAATVTDASTEFINAAEKAAEGERTRHRGTMREIKDYAAYRARSAPRRRCTTPWTPTSLGCTPNTATWRGPRQTPASSRGSERFG